MNEINQSWSALPITASFFGCDFITLQFDIVVPLVTVHNAWHQNISLRYNNEFGNLDLSKSKIGSRISTCLIIHRVCKVDITFYSEAALFVISWLSHRCSLHAGYDSFSWMGSGPFFTRTGKETYTLTLVKSSKQEFGRNELLAVSQLRTTYQDRWRVVRIVVCILLQAVVYQCSGP